MKNILGPALIVIGFSLFMLTTAPEFWEALWKLLGWNEIP